MELGFERPTPGQAIVAALLGLGAFAVPVLGDQAMAIWGVRVTAALLLVVALVVVLVLGRRATRTSTACNEDENGV